MVPNRWMKDNTPFAHLPDGTQLYQAYLPQRPHESHRRSLSRWTGADGEWVTVTAAGQLYRQYRYWANDKPNPNDWEPITIPA